MSHHISVVAVLILTMNGTKCSVYFVGYPLITKLLHRFIGDDLYLSIKI